MSNRSNSVIWMLLGMHEHAQEMSLRGTLDWHLETALMESTYSFMRVS